MSGKHDSSGNEEKTLLINNESNSGAVPVHKGYGARHTFCIMTFWGFFVSYAMRFSMSVAIVAMTNGTTTETNKTKNKECPDLNSNITKKSYHTAQFDWDEAEQGLILSSFFYGYIITQIPGGRLAEKIGGKHLFGFGILITAILTILTPLLSKVGVWALVTARVVEGLGEGLTFPAQYAMQGKWTPSQERTILTSITSAGSVIGNVVCFPLCGYLAQTDFLGGWPANFYIFGIAACIWWVLWVLLIHETPADHPRITMEERTYIEAFSGTKQKYPSPWKHILLSPAVWALNFSAFSGAFCYYITMTSVPTYMSRILKFDVTEDGLLMALPNISNVVFSLASALFADFAIAKGVSVVLLRKSAVLLGGLLTAACYPLITYVGCNHYLVVVMLVLSNGFLGFFGTHITANILDIGNHFAGTLMGIINFCANLSGVISPYLVGLITNHDDTMSKWNIAFLVTMGVNIAGVLAYVLLGQAHSQSWNSPVQTITVTYTSDSNTISNIQTYKTENGISRDQKDGPK